MVSMALLTQEVIEKALVCVRVGKAAVYYAPAKAVGTGAVPLWNSR